jgi:hypothetical protein
LLIGKPEGKRPLEVTVHRWEDNIKMDLWETGFKGEDYIDKLSLVVGSSEHGHEPSGSINGREFLG